MRCFCEEAYAWGVSLPMSYLNDKELDLLESGIEWPEVTNK